MSRRAVLRGLAVATAASATGAVAAWELAGAKIVGNTVPSAARIPEPYTLPGRSPIRARPFLVDNAGEHYRFVQRRARTTVIPGYETEIWGYDGRFPGPTIRARRGRPVLVHVLNELDVPTVMHLHGGHTPAESDGYPTDLVVPASWPKAPRHDAGMSAHDPSARVTVGTRTYTYPNDQDAATLWYHDHRMDFTGASVWRGLAGMYILDDPDEERFGLPAGERDLPMILTDRSFDRDGGLAYPAIDATGSATPGVTDRYMMGVFGDVLLVNGVPWPRYRVPGVRHRLRWLNASNARVYRLRLDGPHTLAPALVQIGSDGGLLPAPQEMTRIDIAPGERFDTVLDLSGHRTGDVVTIVNDLGAGRMVEVARFEVTEAVADTSRVPDRFGPEWRLPRTEVVRTRDLHFQMGDLDDGRRGWLINGRGFDPGRSDVDVELGGLEVWRISSNFNHPVHVHLNHFQVLSVNGRAPRPGDRGWKDTVNLGAGERAEIAVRFTDQAGRFLVHCHNLEHEDMGMMANLTVRE
ncbi:multicopper oxidase domain-containing protein [Tsukamurella paurometabola]|nr:multicopper oxidase domain-containing protein [Tsukamurella paurometabola]UEA83809.1 multicopper oxidase domain-containing protein [Tsukamurella paurometabola]